MMLFSLEHVLIGVGLLVVISVFASKIADRFGIPSLMIFLVLGMLAGSEGLGGIYFDDPGIAQPVGIVSLALILFAGGLDTEWRSVRPVARYAVPLATVGVLLTALVTGTVAAGLMKMSLLGGLLLGATVSSTDAAAVFSILRSKSISLKGQLRPLLELESGSNDPMAVFLTTSLLQWLGAPSQPWPQLVGRFFVQMAVGAAVGYFGARGMVFLINRARLGYDGLYSVLTLGCTLLIYAVTAWLGGNGFLAVFLAGLTLGRYDFIHKRSLTRFHDGVAWLMQIVMFLTLGLLVFPSRLIPLAGSGLLLAFCLMLVARPLAVFLTLLPARGLAIREKTFISWVGLRGAAPIVLATFPLLAKAPHAELIFNAVFFIVLASVLLQGTLVPHVAKWLRVDAPFVSRRDYPIEYTGGMGFRNEFKELLVPPGSRADGRQIVDLNLPPEFLVILIARESEFLVPSGGTRLQGGDTLLVISDREAMEQVMTRTGMVIMQ